MHWSPCVQETEREYRIKIFIQSQDYRSKEKRLQEEVDSMHLMNGTCDIHKSMLIHVRESDIHSRRLSINTHSCVCH